MTAARERRVCIHQPVYLPWLGFFHKLAISDVWVVLDDCQAIKQSWMNRTWIYTRGGRSWLTVPVLFKHRSGQLVRDMEINASEKWPKKHLRTLRQYYAKAACFGEVEGLLADVLSDEHTSLMALDLSLVRGLLRLLGIEVEVVHSTALGASGYAGTDRLIELTRRVGGTTYVCGMGSAGYLQPERFDQEGIGLEMQRYRPLPYPQVGGPFEPGLSAVDTLANVGREGAAELLARNGVGGRRATLAEAR